MKHVKNFQDFLNEGMWSKSELAAMYRVPMNARYFLTDEDGNVLERDLKTMSSVASTLRNALKFGKVDKQYFQSQPYGKVPEFVNVHDMKNDNKVVEQYSWDPERKQTSLAYLLVNPIDSSKVSEEFYFKGNPIILQYDSTKQKNRAATSPERTNEALSMDAVYIHQIIGAGQDVIQDFIDDNNIDGKKLADYVKAHRDSKEQYDVHDMIRGVGVGAVKNLRARFMKNFKK
jgi:hypothetical protein